MNSGFLFGMLLFFTAILAIALIYAGFAIYFAGSRINSLKDELETAELKAARCKLNKSNALEKALNLSKKLDKMAEEFYLLRRKPPKGYYISTFTQTLERKKEDGEMQ